MPYPTPLPCVSRVEGHSTTAYAALMRTAMEAGNCRQRRVHRQLPQRLSLVFVMDQAIYATWFAWVNANAYADFVLMTLPGVLASRNAVDTTPTPVRFLSDIACELLPVHRLWIWRCRVEAEWIPLS